MFVHKRQMGKEFFLWGSSALVMALALVITGCAGLDKGNNPGTGNGTPEGDTPEQNPEVADYYPLVPGAVWKYKLTKTETGETFDETVMIEKPKEMYGHNCYVLREDGPEGTKRTYVTVEGNEVRVVAKTEGAFKILVRLSPPIHLVTIPLKVGTKWESKCVASAALISEKVAVQYNVIAKAKTTVPAGTYDAFIVHMQQTTGDKVKNRLLWYSPGVGMIKYSGGDYDKELSEFILPGDGDDDSSGASESKPEQD